ncbi:MAG: endo alpha-1,4 polygalactosaminidase [Myxococcales bacterium]|nr:endo alpha-1,4 polygalactosaminidase [Myxococcales bacterium]
MRPRWIVLAIVAACSSPRGADEPVEAGPADAATADAAGGDGADPTIALPPANAGLDYQLGGAYPPAADVRVLSRDRAAAPAAGLYNICYVNGFQIQPDEVGFWTSQHPELMLRDGNGDLVIDADWNEILIDVRTPTKRAAVAAIVGDWIAGCAAAGFDAVEIDNLDTFARSGGLIVENDAVATMALFAAAAHRHGLAIAQKNSAELVGRRAELGTDFVVAEECNQFDECDVYTAAYGAQVYVIEYRRAAFTAGCAGFPQLSIVLRDRDLVPSGASGYVFDGC